MWMAKITAFWLGGSKARQARRAEYLDKRCSDGKLWRDRIGSWAVEVGYAGPVAAGGIMRQGTSSLMRLMV
jgi:hypothetical protein